MKDRPAGESPPWRLWQLLDSGFPSGGFAHSAGLEAAHQCDLVGGTDGVEAFVRWRWAESATGALVFVRHAWQQPAQLAALDRACDAFTANPVANRASRRQGVGLVTVAARSFDEPALVALDADHRSENRPGHLPVAFGAVAAALRTPLPTTLHAFLFVEARAVFSAAVRLDLVGPLDAQARLARLGRDTDTLLQRSAVLGLGDIHQTSPALELVAGQHDRLYSKLFQS